MEITDNSSDFQKWVLEVVELVQIQLTWIETNSVFPDQMPEKIVVGLNMDLELLDLINKAVVILHTTIDKTMENCKEFYMKMSATHNRC